MNEILERIAGKRILVAGDIMLDRYWWGSVGRISPEAPVPIVNLERTTVVVGGAANVAANIAGLGAVPLLFGVHGDDDEANALPDLLNAAGVDAKSLLGVPGRKTTVKTRIVAHSQHVVRIDQETVEHLDGEIVDRCFDKIDEVLASVDAVILSDYAKGFLTDTLIKGIIERAHHHQKLLIVDPKGRDFTKYKGASAITPNRREAADACRIADSKASVAEAGVRLMASLATDAVLITEGENGMTLFDQAGTHQFSSLAQEVFDVTGAGDTVIGVFTCALAAGASFLDAAGLANAAAGVVVGHVGTTCITRQMLTDKYSNEGLVEARRV
jgi:rfaE bifunctional protein kinase chain/domain